jgi:uncharacterized protein DUF6790
VFLFLLMLVLLGAGIHVASLQTRTPEKIGELFLLYLLVGYCGVPMLIFSAWALLSPEAAAAHLGFPAGNPFQEFAGLAFLAMSILSILTLRYRRSFLIAPAILWAVFFAGATLIHFKDFHHKGVLTHGSMVHIFATHGLIAVLLIAALLASGLLKERP